MAEKMVFVTLCGNCKFSIPHYKYPDYIKCRGRLSGRVLPSDFYCKSGKPLPEPSKEDT